MNYNCIFFVFWQKNKKTPQCRRIFRIMRISIFLLFMCSTVMFADNSYSQNARVTINRHNVPLETVLDDIESQTDYLFLYDRIQIDMNKNTTVNVKNMPVKELLTSLFSDESVNFVMEGSHIVLLSSENKVSVSQQTLTITGTVTDTNGEALSGVNVVIKGTTTGVITDAGGLYSINVPNGEATLLFSYIGYVSQEVTVGNQRTINVILKDDIKMIDEVIVVGYGIQKKQSVVSSIVQASNEELSRSGNVTDVRQALAGRLPGVITTMSTGEPGGYGDGSSATSIFIRGRNSWNNSAPLILVDGAERNMNNIDMNEIETISVLKDASATAVFGVKGANGVILITTRRGKEGRPEFNISYDATSLFISKLPDKLDSYDALRIRNESIERDVSLNETLWSYYTPTEILRRYRQRDYPEYEYVYPNVNWTDALFKKAGWSQRASLSVRGGTNFVKYFGSLSYLHEGDMFRDYDNHKTYDPSYAFNRFNFRSNFDFTLTKTTSFQVNLSGYYSQKNTNNSYYQITSGSNRMIFAAAYYMPPDFYVPQYPDGTWGVSTNSVEKYANPVAQLYNLGIAYRRTTSLNTDFTLVQQLDFITPGLKLKSSIYYDNAIASTSTIQDITNNTRPEPGANTPATIVNPGLYKSHDQDPSEYMWFAITNPSTDFDWVVRPWTREGEAVVLDAISRRLAYDVQLDYSRKFGLHNVGATGVFRREEQAIGSMFPTYREDWIFRVMYDYNTKYILEANGAYNGTEKWSKNYRFDLFPSLGVVWYLSNEKFYNIKWLNRAKLRYTVGWVGDDSGGARWMYQAQYAYGGDARLQSGANANSESPYIFYREAAVANPDARWEKSKKDNYGLELGLFNDALSINADYFTEKRYDMMVPGGSRAVPPYFGATPPAANLGKLNARGYEVSVSLNKRTSMGIDYWVSAYLTHTRNKIVFIDDPQLLFDYQKAQGFPMYQTKSQIRRNIYQNWDEVYASTPQTTNDQNKIPGFYNIVDFNGDGVITGDDNPPYGYPDTPENTYNLTLGASYKGFSATVQFYGVNNVTRNAPLTSFDDGYSTVYGHARDYWSKDNPNASSFLPRYLTQGSFYGNYYLVDGSYIRLKTAEIAYSFRKPILNYLGVSNLRLFVNGNDLWLWTRLPDDREDTWNGGSAAYGAYPTLKRINFGLKITF